MRHPRLPRPTRPLTPLTLLALTVILCGSMGDATAAAVVLQHSQERVSTQHPRNDRDDEVATILSCLEEAAKGLRKLDTQVAALPAPGSVEREALSIARLPDRSLTPYALRLTLHALIDLPPPAVR